MARAHRTFKISSGVGKHKVELVLTLVGNDVVAVISGGDRPHVGAISVAIPRPSLKDASKLSATSSVFTLTGHKDDEVTRPASEALAKELNGVAVVSAGVHIDGASREDIRKLVENTKKALKDAIRMLKKGI